MYQALYRKWRPKVFEDVLGQAHITGTLKNQIVNKKLSHAYLFSGTRGTGKTSTAKILARAVNCENSVDGNPCNACYACLSALDGRAVDIIEMDAASNNKVEDARMIRDEVIYTPNELRYKVYIIDEAHMLTSNAFNALLKTLEEPPSHIIFIFATTEPQKFPATILSRCQRFDFKRITAFDIGKRIKQIISSEGCEITDEAVNLVVRVADGSMRDALSLLDQCIALSGKSITAENVAEIAGVSDPKFIFDFADSVIRGDIAAAMKFVKQAYDKGFDMQTACDELLGCFRNVMVAKSLTKKEDVSEILNCSESETNTYCKMANDVSLERVLRYIDMLENAVNSETFLANPRLSLEIALTGMLKRPDISEPQGILEKLMELENRVRRLEQGKPQPLKTAAENQSFETVHKEEKQEQNEFEENKSHQIPKISENTENTENSENSENSENAEMTEKPDYPMYEEQFVPYDSNDSVEELKSMWGDVLLIASKNSLAGFDTIMKGAEVEFTENGLNILFESESFFKIAQMNKFDENIVNAYKTVGGTDVAVKMRVGKIPNEKEDNFGLLLQKIKNGDNVEYL